MPRTAVRISDVPRTTVPSLRRVLKPTINITDVARVGPDRDLYFVPSQFGTNPRDPCDHLSRHLGYSFRRRRPGRLIAPRTDCSHYTAGRHTLAGMPLLGRIIQGAFVFGSALGHMAVPGRALDDDDDAYLQPDSTVTICYRCTTL